MNYTMCKYTMNYIMCNTYALGLGSRGKYLMCGFMNYIRKKLII